MSDPLDGAVRASQSAVPGDADPIATRVRLLRSLARADRAFRMRIAFLIVVALVATNSTTWAWSTGRAAQVIDAVRGRIASHATPPRRPRAAPVPLAPSAVVAAAPDPAPAAIAAREPAVLSPPHRIRAPSAALAPTAPPTPVVIPEPPTDTREREEFARALGVDVGHRDDAAAVALWDDYLARFPAGRFVPEARWNRAVDLVRLGRAAEAREALAPFADGSYPGFRESEARILLAGLSR